MNEMSIEQKGSEGVDTESIVEVRYLQECLGCPYQVLIIKPAITKNTPYVNGPAQEITIGKPEVVCEHFTVCKRMQHLMWQKYHKKKMLHGRQTERASKPRTLIKRFNLIIRDTKWKSKGVN